MSFYGIIGHNKIKSQIEKSIKSDRFSHAHIFVGEDGIGKSIIARETSLQLLGKENHRQYADIVEYGMNMKRKSIGIDEIKNLIEEVNKKPYEGNRKVIIVHRADRITETAQNAFLKTIEEPPQGIYIILLCEKLDSILDTIQSRCEVYKFNRLGNTEICDFLEMKFHNLNLSDEEKKAAIAFSDGIPGRIERFINDNSLREIRNISVEILQHVQEEDIEFISTYSALLSKYKAQWQEILTCILSYIRDVFIYKETGNEKLLINNDKFQDIKSIGEMFSFNRLDNIIDIIRNVRTKLENNVNTDLVFDSMLSKIQEV